MGAVPPRYRVQVTLRLEMPARPAPVMQAVQARSAIAVLATAGCTRAAMAGYGPDHAVAGYAPAIREAAAGAGITMTELLRVQPQRWWSDGCRVPSCCPADGTPLSAVPDPEIAGPLEAAGCRVLPRQGRGRGRHRARHRGRRARCPAGRAAGRGPRWPPGPARGPARTGGNPAADRHLRGPRGAGGCSRLPGRGSITSLDEVAWLARVLCEPDVRDAAWRAMEPDYREAHLGLWACVTRFAQLGLVAAPACLLALVAWQWGNGVLARLALDRAKADQPGYDLACVLRLPIESGAPPPSDTPAVILARLRPGPRGPGLPRSSRARGGG
jgi:hypothetical protein